jgi:hypothetical protein
MLEATLKRHRQLARIEPQAPFWNTQNCQQME